MILARYPKPSSGLDKHPIHNSACPSYKRDRPKLCGAGLGMRSAFTRGTCVRPLPPARQGTPFPGVYPGSTLATSYSFQSCCSANPKRIARVTSVKFTTVIWRISDEWLWLGWVLPPGTVSTSGQLHRVRYAFALLLLSTQQNYQ